jgi:hypothetical protein
MCVLNKHKWCSEHWRILPNSFTVCHNGTTLRPPELAFNVQVHLIKNADQRTSRTAVLKIFKFCFLKDNETKEREKTKIIFAVTFLPLVAKLWVVYQASQVWGQYGNKW